MLILGDEGLQILSVSGLRVKFVDCVPWETAEFEATVFNKIKKDCRNKPVIILNDMVEQHYRKERIPKVSVMDRANVLKRRLNVAFPNYQIRSALKLSNKSIPISTGDGGVLSGGAYLFAAIPNSSQVQKTVEAVRLSGAPIVGLYLLPVEGASLVRALKAKLVKGSKNKSGWTIFVGQHHNGGLRQIVIRDGELALTRLSPVVDTDIEPELWVKEVSAELDSTMSYLSRFGYTTGDGLNIIIIANDATHDLLEQTIRLECDLHVLTSKRAASMLGVSIGRHDDLRYADILHAAFLAKKNKFALPMLAPAITRLTKPRRMASFIILGLLLAFGVLGFLTFKNWASYIQTNDQLIVSTQQNKMVKQEYKTELDKQKRLGFDFLFVNNAIEIYEGLEKNKVSPLPLFRDIGRSLGADIHLDQVVVSAVEEEINDPQADLYYNPDAQPTVVTLMNVVMTISFPSSIDPDIGAQKVLELEQKLSTDLPDYDVRIIKQVADLSYTGNFVGESGQSRNPEGAPEEYTAEIEVREKLPPLETTTDGGIQ